MNELKTAPYTLKAIKNYNNKTRYISFRLWNDDFEKLKTIADNNNQSIGGYVKDLIKLDIAEREKAKG